MSPGVNAGCFMCKATFTVVPKNALADFRDILTNPCPACGKVAVGYAVPDKQGPPGS